MNSREIRETAKSLLKEYEVKHRNDFIKTLMIPMYNKSEDRVALFDTSEGIDMLSKGWIWAKPY